MQKGTENARKGLAEQKRHSTEKFHQRSSTHIKTPLPLLATLPRRSKSSKEIIALITGGSNSKRNFTKNRYRARFMCSRSAKWSYNDPTLLDRLTGITIRKNYIDTLKAKQEYLPILKQATSPRIIKVARQLVGWQSCGSQELDDEFISNTLTVPQLPTSTVWENWGWLHLC